MTPKAWSFSALNRFVNCPKQYHEITVKRRIKDVDGPDAGYGHFVHEHGEKYLRAKGDYVLPANPPHINGFPQIAEYKGYFDAILRLPGEIYIEANMALDAQLQPVAYYDPRVWVRGKADVVAIHNGVARGLDHKTGKRKPSNQMVLMALLIFQHHPEVHTVKTAFFWLKEKSFDHETYVRADIPSMWNQFVTGLHQYVQAFKTDTWQPRQSGLCHGWCPVTDCEFWKPKKVRTR